MSDAVEHVTDLDFEQKVIKSDILVLVDFWAPWCGPCRMVGPVLEELAKEYAGRIKVVKVNVDEEQKIAGSLGIRSIPTMIIYKDGDIKETTIGAQGKDALAQLIDRFIDG
ncbi:MAG: thioredoxin [Pseudomonadota bacterium]